MNHILILANALFTLTLAAHSASAETLISGDWTLSKTVCSDGSEAKHFSGGLEGNMTSSIKASDTDLTLKLSLQWKLSEERAQKYLEQIAAAKAAWEAQPDCAQKQEALKQIEKSEAQIRDAAKGASCELNISGQYKTVENKLFLENVVDTSNCQNGGYTNDGTGAVFERNGDTLSINSKVETEDGKSCPKGTSSINVYKKVN